VFSDQEILTIYLFAMHAEQRFKISQIYEYADGYLRSWFPYLSFYMDFSLIINCLSEVFKSLAINLIENLQPVDCDRQNSLLDSLPIITCSGKRKGKVAQEITDKGYCSTKSMFYYGLKLHALAFRRISQLPFPEQFLLTPASENDLNLFRQAWSGIENRVFFGDKIYHDVDYFENAF